MYFPLAFDAPVASLEAPELRAGFAKGAFTPVDVVNAVYDRIEARGADGVWITLVPRHEAVATAAALAGGATDPSTPLFGLPFAVKDNIDAAGLPTTAGCPAFAYDAQESAEVVSRLQAAGAILVGKTNLDQFATGLNGTRTPYGVPTSTFDPAYISGGSSSGSGVAVSAGLVTFSIGTDTAGSGRVPAALNNVVGIKPSRGLVSTRGLVPACRSLDCISIFSLTVADGTSVLSAISGADGRDPWSQTFAPIAATIEQAELRGLVFAIPRHADLDFGGDSAAAEAWQSVCDSLRAVGATLVPTDFGPFFDAGKRLYSGGWLAERTAGLEAFLDEHPSELMPVTREVLDGGRAVTGSQVFRDVDEARTISSCLAPLWQAVDALLTPTVTTTYTVAEMLADPIALNSRLGRFTTFTNILDLAAIAVPAGIAGSGRPFGVTVSATSGSDARLGSIAAALEARVAGTLGATVYSAAPSAALPTALSPASAPAQVLAPVSAPASVAADPAAYLSDDTTALIAVVGAHLSGMPLNAQVTDLGGLLIDVTRTAPVYRLHVLEGTHPLKPGLKRVGEGGTSIAVEIYRLPVEGFGRFVTLVPPPLAIGTLELYDGSQVNGFVCEPFALDDAPDISDFGGWRAYLAHKAALA
ncbi:allophanate hydrolase [soil metagenome]